MEHIDMRVATVVRELAGRKGWSMNALAREAGEPVSNVRKYFYVGEAPMKLEALQKVADAFDRVIEGEHITVSWIFARADVTTPDPWIVPTPRGRGAIAITGRKGKGGNGIRKIGGGSDDSPSGPLTIV